MNFLGKMALGMKKNLSQLYGGFCLGAIKSEVPRGQRVTVLEARFVHVRAFNTGQGLVTH